MIRTCGSRGLRRGSCGRWSSWRRRSLWPPCSQTEPRAAPWCGTTTTEDRPATVTGHSIRVVYAIPSDGADRSAERAPQISADVDEIAAWWRTQDFEREPRFDRATFACGPQADILVFRLAEGAAALQADETRFEKITDALVRDPRQPGFDKHLVYYDGPTGPESPCGEGGGTADGAGIAIVYLAMCAAVPTEVVATHELLHAFGALPAGGPPNACPDSSGHPCDSPGDILYPYAPAARLAALALDVGRNDYYAHPGTWLDVQDSRWLRLVTRQIRLALTITGGGSVEGDLPGVECSASCTTEWDQGSELVLDALPAEGQRFVRWSGACTGADSCSRDARRGAGGHGPLRAGALPAHALRRGSRLRDGHQRALHRPPLRPERELVHDAPARRHRRHGLALRRLVGGLRPPSRRVHGADDEGDVRPGAVRQARAALSQVSSVVWRGAASPSASSPRSSPTVPHRSATTSWSWIVSRFTWRERTKSSSASPG